jgi:hypothetical protein
VISPINLLLNVSVPPPSNRIVLTVDVVKAQCEKQRKRATFPELSRVDMSEKGLEYLIKKHEFEESFPATNARRAANPKKWMKEKGGLTVDAVKEGKSIQAGRRKYEKDISKPEGSSEEAEPKEMEGLDEDLDEFQSTAMEEIRARRASRRETGKKP